MLRFVIAFMIVLFTSSYSFSEIVVKDWKLSLDALAQFNTYYVRNTDGYPFNSTSGDDTELNSECGSGTRIRMTAEHKHLKFFFDFREDNEFEYIWGEWNFGAGKMLIGRNDPLSFNPLMLPPPKKSGVGQMIGQPILDQIRLTFPLGKTTLALAALDPDDYYADQLEVGTGTADTDSILPTFEAKYSFPVGPVNLSIIGGLQQYTLVDTSDQEYDINSSMLGLTAHYRHDQLGLHGTFFWDKNDYSHGGDPRQKGLYFMAINSGNYFGGPAYDAASDSIVDSEAYVWAVSADYRVNDDLIFMLGCSGSEVEDDFGNEDEVIGYSALAIVDLTDSIQVVPFVNMSDWGTRTPHGGSSIDEGETIQFGVQWMFWFDVL